MSDELNVCAGGLSRRQTLGLALVVVAGAAVRRTMGAPDPSLRVVIVPDIEGISPAECVWLSAFRVPESYFASDTLKLRAVLTREGQFVEDITNNVEWTASGGALVSAPGAIKVVGSANGVVMAKFGDVATTNYGIFKDDAGVRWKQPAGGGGGGGNPPPPIGGEALRGHIRDAIRQIENGGVNLGQLPSVINNTNVNFRDNAQTGAITGNDFGLTTQSGANVAGSWLGLTSVSPTVTLAAQLAQDLANGRGFDANGIPTRALTTAIHEAIHAMVMTLGITATGLTSAELVELEEAICHNFENAIKAAVELRAVMNQGRPTTQGQAYRLGRLINRIRNFYRQFQPYRPNNPANNTPAKDAARRKFFDDIMRNLNWADADGNGLPDWLDQWLRENNIDPATLPTRPPADPNAPWPAPNNPGPKPREGGEIQPALDRGMDIVPRDVITLDP